VAAATDRSSEGESVVKSEENGGGGRKGALLAEASDVGYCGGGDCCCPRASPVAPLSAPERDAAACASSSVKRTSSFSGMPASSSTLRRSGRTGREEGEDSEGPSILGSRDGNNLAVGDGHRPFATRWFSRCRVV
jgi:hypothetical protein